MTRLGVIILKKVWSWRSRVIALMAPLLLAFLFMYDGTEYQQQARCAYVLLLLVIYWTTECIPIAVTGLLPMLLYPLLEIAAAKDLAPRYMKEVILAFMGSYILVISFERANLHKRLALRILKIVGPQPRWLLFGILMSACFLSMFTNNTVSCALHLPIVKGIIDEMREASRQQSGKKSVKSSSASLGHPPKGENIKTEIQKMKGGVVHHEEGETSLTNSATTVATASTETGELSQVSSRPAPGDSIESAKSKEIEATFVNMRMRKNDRSSETSSASSKKNGRHDRRRRHSVDGHMQTPTNGHHHHHHSHNHYHYEDNALSRKTISGLDKMLLIAAAYGSSIGGMCTLIGTPTNLIMKERAEHAFARFNCTSQPVNFASWFIMGFPTGVTFIILAWFWLQTYFLGPSYVYRVWILDTCRKIFRRPSTDSAHPQHHMDRVKTVIQQLNAALEPMGFKQYAVLGHCLLLILLLITRQLSAGGSQGYVGWGIIAPKYVGESTAAILVMFLMFIFPSEWPKMNDKHSPPPLLTWKQVEKSFPFGVILLLGGGMAATYGATASGLPELIAPVIYNVLSKVHISLAILITSIMVAVMTEAMSNVACVTLLSPVVEELTYELGVNPLLFMLPMALSASFAFMLPVATLPNALIFSTNRIRLKDMVLCGIGSNLIGMLVVFLAVHTWGNAYFSLFEPPSCT